MVSLWFSLSQRKTYCCCLWDFFPKTIHQLRPQTRLLQAQPRHALHVALGRCIGLFAKPGQCTACESRPKPGIKMVDPEPCKESRRRPLIFMVGIVPYEPSSTQVLIVAHVVNSSHAIWLWVKTYIVLLLNIPSPAKIGSKMGAWHPPQNGIRLVLTLATS